MRGKPCSRSVAGLACGFLHVWLIVAPRRAAGRQLPLKVVAGNPCSTVAPARMYEISQNFTDVSIGILSGTRVQMNFEDHLHFEDAARHDVLHVGWSKQASRANTSCGVAFMLSKKYKFKQNIVYSDPGPEQLRGRLGIVRAKTGHYDITALNTFEDGTAPTYFGHRSFHTAGLHRKESLRVLEEISNRTSARWSRTRFTHVVDNEWKQLVSDVRTVGMKYLAKEQKVDKPDGLLKLHTERDELSARRKEARKEDTDRCWRQTAPYVPPLSAQRMSLGGTCRPTYRFLPRSLPLRRVARQWPGDRHDQSGEADGVLHEVQGGLAGGPGAGSTVLQEQAGVREGALQGDGGTTGQAGGHAGPLGDGDVAGGRGDEVRTGSPQRHGKGPPAVQGSGGGRIEERAAETALGSEGRVHGEGVFLSGCAA